MHEYGLMQDVVKLAVETCRRDGDREVVRVRIEVGEFAVASRESLQTAYEILTRGTPLEGSSLEIAEVPGHAVCEACGFAGSAADLGDEVSEPPALILCPHCGSPLLVTAGAGIALVDVQLEDRGHLEAGTPVRGGR
jgi:hydrogenase nickel incorporation protein HypA/HybF